SAISALKLYRSHSWTLYKCRPPSSTLLPAASTTCVTFFFFNDPTTTEIYTLSLHDALPICGEAEGSWSAPILRCAKTSFATVTADRKSTRLNSSHSQTSYAVFCLKKKIQDAEPGLLLLDVELLVPQDERCDLASLPGARRRV